MFALDGIRPAQKRTRRASLLVMLAERLLLPSGSGAVVGPPAPASLPLSAAALQLPLPRRLSLLPLSHGGSPSSLSPPRPQVRRPNLALRGVAAAGSGESRGCGGGWRRRPSPPLTAALLPSGSGEGAARSTSGTGRAALVERRLLPSGFGEVAWVHSLTPGMILSMQWDEFVAPRSSCWLASSPNESSLRALPRSTARPLCPSLRCQRLLLSSPVTCFA